jgi:two-component system, NarL family, response regulator
VKTKPPVRSKLIGVIVADDHPVVREGLTCLVKSQPDMRLLGEAENGCIAVQQYFRLRPEVILLDLKMPELDGVEATKAILSRDPKAKIIVLSTYKGDEDVFQCLRAGAKAYLLKESSRREVTNCIRSVHEGNTILSSLAGEQLASWVTHDRLTKREAQILKLVAAGKGNKEIGATLGIMEGTVKVHAGRIFKKLRVNGRTAAVRIALERGLVHLSHV